MQITQDMLGDYIWSDHPQNKFTSLPNKKIKIF